MARQANEIDFWRGAALVTIFVDHVPGISFEGYTLHNFAISDAAEIFVFLAGCSFRFMMAGLLAKGAGLAAILARIARRIGTLAVTQIGITEIALASTLLAAVWRDDAAVRDIHNAAAMFTEPLKAHLGLAVMTHQLQYFDILPLYIALLAMSPVIVLCELRAPRALLPLSLVAYGVTQASGANLPTWPVEGTWYFNPFAWQLMFVLGYTLGRPSRGGGFLSTYRPLIRLLSVPVLAAAVACRMMELDSFSEGSDFNWLFSFDKTFLTLPRVICCLAMIGVFGGGFRQIRAVAEPVADFLSYLGRNSLCVFSVGSLLAIWAQIVRFEFGGGWLLDSLLFALALCGMCAAAGLPVLSGLARGVRARGASLIPAPTAAFRS